MAGWLTLMLIVAIAGRKTTRELNVFEIMEVRSISSVINRRKPPKVSATLFSWRGVWLFRVG